MPRVEPVVPGLSELSTVLAVLTSEFGFWFFFGLMVLGDLPFNIAFLEIARLVSLLLPLHSCISSHLTVIASAGGVATLMTSELASGRTGLDIACWSPLLISHWDVLASRRPGENREIPSGPSRLAFTNLALPRRSPFR